MKENLGPSFVEIRLIEAVNDLFNKVLCWTKQLPFLLFFFKPRNFVLPLFFACVASYVQNRFQIPMQPFISSCHYSILYYIFNEEEETRILLVPALKNLSRKLAIYILLRKESNIKIFRFFFPLLRLANPRKRMDLVLFCF